MSPVLPPRMASLTSYSRFRGRLQMQPEDYLYNNTFMATLRTSVAEMTRLGATEKPPGPGGHSGLNAIPKEITPPAGERLTRYR